MLGSKLLVTERFRSLLALPWIGIACEEDIVAVRILGCAGQRQSKLLNLRVRVSCTTIGVEVPPQLFCNIFKRRWRNDAILGFYMHR